MNRLAIVLAALAAMAPIAALADEQPQPSSATVIYAPTTTATDAVPDYVRLEVGGA